MHTDQAQPVNDPLEQPGSGPELTVVIPTHGRSQKLANLLDRIDRQTIDRSRFECIVVDDGSPEPVRLDPERYSFSLQLIRCNQGGPGHARNQALPHSRGRYTLYLNDDAVPALDLLEQHLAAHAASSDKTVVLGTFHFTKRARESAFVQLLSRTNLLFTFLGLEPNKDLSWGYFWTCNLSLDTEALRLVDGFDASLFDEPIVEDVELGYRLETEGYTVRHFPSCVAEHDHMLTPRGYVERMERLGFYLARMWAKHNNRHILWMKSDADLQRLVNDTLTGAEQHLKSAPAMVRALEEFEEKAAGQVLDTQTIERLTYALREVSTGPWLHGIHHAITGVDARTMAREGAPKGMLTTIVMVSHNALAMTQSCIASLRRTADHERPTEIIVVDNGSTDGSAEWLAEQPDLRLIANPTNIGAPAARNQALALGYGDYVCFVDNDIVVTQGWLERAQYHAAADPRVGCVPFCAQRASKHQVVPYEGDGSEEQLEAFAAERLKDYHRRGQQATLFASFGVLVKSQVIDTIGGFDLTFSPWGFEDDDFAMRSLRAGFKNRVAMDVFVYHAPYPDAEKSRRHADHMQSNWEAFASKWGPEGTPVPPLFDYPALQLDGSSARDDVELYCHLAVPEQEQECDVPRLQEGIARAITSLQGLDRSAIASCGPDGQLLADLAARLLDSLNAQAPGCDASPAPEPIPLRTEARQRLFAWPRYDTDADLEALLREYGPTLCAADSTCLCLRHDPAIDGPLEIAIERLQRTYTRTLGERELEVLVVDDPLGVEQLPALGQAVLAAIDLAPGDAQRSAFLRGTQARLVRSPQALAAALEPVPVKAS